MEKKWSEIMPQNDTVCFLNPILLYGNIHMYKHRKFKTESEKNLTTLL